MKNCTKYQSAIKIRDVAGTPNVYYTIYMQSRNKMIQNVGMVTIAEHFCTKNVL